MHHSLGLKTGIKYIIVIVASAITLKMGGWILRKFGLYNN
jgi:hypothetical protein